MKGCRVNDITAGAGNKIHVDQCLVALFIVTWPLIPQPRSIQRARGLFRGSDQILVLERRRVLSYVCNSRVNFIAAPRVRHARGIQDFQALRGSDQPQGTDTGQVHPMVPEGIVSATGEEIPFRAR